MSAESVSGAVPAGPTPPVLWIVQTNLGGQSDIATWLGALDAEAIPYRRFDVVPFSAALPAVEYDGPVVCYGSTNFVMNCRAAGRWIPGVWHDQEKFTWSAWAKHLGDLLLNSPDTCERTTIGALRGSSRADDELVFVRPDRDLKEFSGEVAEVGRFRAWCRDVAEGAFEQLRPDTPIVLCTPFRIRTEWRLFLVDRAVVTASQYRRDGRLSVQAGAPGDVLAFGEAVATRWSPASVFTLDVCRSGESLFVLEAQGFNSAGHYAADLKALVRAVSAQAAREWQAAQ
jgi:hypothetical protein